MVRTRCTGGGGPRVEAASIPPLVLEPFQVLRGRAADRHRGHAELAMVPRSDALDVDAHRDALACAVGAARRPRASAAVLDELRDLVVAHHDLCALVRAHLAEAMPSELASLNRLSGGSATQVRG